MSRRKVLWAIKRGNPVDYAIEKIVKVGPEYWFEATETKDAAPDGKPQTLRTGPWKSAEAVVEGYPETMSIRTGDVVSTNRLPPTLVSERLRSDEYEVVIGNEAWNTLCPGAAIPDSCGALGSWSNEDRYGFPGGDRSSELLEVGHRYLVRDENGWIEALTDVDGCDEAIEQWIDRYLPAYLEPLPTLTEALEVDYPETAYQVVVDQVVVEACLDPVCCLRGVELYDPDAFDAWWSDVGRSEYEDLERIPLRTSEPPAELWNEYEEVAPGVWLADTYSELVRDGVEGTLVASFQIREARPVGSEDAWLFEHGDHYVYEATWEGLCYLGQFDSTDAAVERWKAEVHAGLAALPRDLSAVPQEFMVLV